MVHPHRVDAELRHVRGDFLRIIVRGEIGVETGIHAPHPEPPRIREKMSVTNAHKAIRPGRPWRLRG